MELVHYRDPQSRVATALIVGRRVKLMSILVIETRAASGDKPAKPAHFVLKNVPLSEERYMRPVDMGRRQIRAARAATRRLAKHSSPAVKKIVREVLK